MVKLTVQDKELIAIAKKTAKRFTKNKWKGDKISTVGAALRTTDGSVFTGPNIFHPYSSPASMCAEYNVIAQAYAKGYKKFDIIVAYHYRSAKEKGFYPPCGNCREFLRLFGNPWVILSNTKKERLNKLLPFE